MTRDPPLANLSQSTFPSGLAELAPRYDLLLCDLWGVVHNGRHVFAPAVAALRRFRDGGGTVVFITNAPRPQAPVPSHPVDASRERPSAERTEAV